jgi:diacylglycerol kinase family enzyme
MKTLLIVNPHSKSGKSDASARKLTKYLKDKGLSFDLVEIEQFEDAFNYSAQANFSGIENIVAVGGDGTINKVLNGFYDNNGKRVSDSRFGVVHTGTSPDFCKSYNIPTDLLKAADVIIKQKVTKIPVGMIKLKSEFQKAKAGNSVIDSSACSDNSFETRYFACCANIGLGAELARTANSGIRGYLGDFLGTLISFLKILLSYKGTDYNVLINNKQTELKNIINISVGITEYIASGLNVYKDKSIPDDQFYILKTAEVKLANILKLLKILYSGKEFSNTPYLSLEYAGRIEVIGNAVHPEVEFDGDPAGFLPCTIEIAKDRLPVFTN